MGEHGERTPACISHIFAKEPGEDFGIEELSISDGGIKKIIRDSTGSIFPGYFQFTTPPFMLGRRGGGARGMITGFSKGSRLRMMKLIARLKNPPLFWQTLTFADDTMAEASITDRKLFSSDRIHRFNEEIIRKFSVEGIWRREWEPRRSGLLSGELCPHFHIMIWGEDVKQSNYEKLCHLLGEVWVRNTKTKDPNALDVTLHTKSYEWLESRKKAAIYVSKYMAKLEKHEIKESIGRCWGYIGKPELAEKIEFKLSKLEQVWFKRLLRRYVRKRNGLRTMIDTGVGFLFISRETTIKMINYAKGTVKEMALKTICEGTPF